MIYILMKCNVPDHYQEAGHAVLEVDKQFVERIDLLMLAASNMKKTFGDTENFAGIIFESYDPTWVNFGDPEDLGLEGQEASEFENELSDIGWAQITKEQAEKLTMGETEPIDSVQMTVTTSRVSWHGYHKHGGQQHWTRTYGLYFRDFDELKKLLDNSGQ